MKKESHIILFTTTQRPIMKLGFLLFCNVSAFLNALSTPPHTPLPPTPPPTNMLTPFLKHLEQLHNPNVDFVLSQMKTAKEQTGYCIVKSISSALPYVDNIGHKVLHANDVFISQIINMENIPHELKEYIILSSIKMSMMGDVMGGHLLHLYYMIVEKSF